MFFWITLAVILSIAAIAMNIIKRNSPEQDLKPFAQIPDQLEATIDFMLEELKKDNQSIFEKIQLLRSEYEEKLNKIQLELAKVKEDVQKLQDLNNENMIREKDQKIQSLSNQEDELFQMNERYKPIFAMIRDGLHLDDIAKKTGVGKGEIMLIRELMERKSMI